MNLHARLKKGSTFLVACFCFPILILHAGTLQAAGSLEAAPANYAQGIVLLTPGASTTMENMPGETGIFATVITLGAGTLKVALAKEDTFGDVISMFVIGFPADPPFIPGVAVTPGEISVSTEVTDTLGGAGIIFIVTLVNSRQSYQSTLSLALD